MGDYTRQRETATRLITKNGKSITLNRVTQGAYDPSTGDASEVASTAVGVGVLLKFSNNEIDGSNILSSDRKLIYTGQEPKIDDRYINERVVSVNPLDPDESGAILYTCQLRV